MYTHIHNITKAAEGSERRHRHEGAGGRGWLVAVHGRGAQSDTRQISYHIISGMTCQVISGDIRHNAQTYAYHIIKYHII